MLVWFLHVPRLASETRIGDVHGPLIIPSVTFATVRRDQLGPHIRDAYAGASGRFRRGSVFGQGVAVGQSEVSPRLEIYIMQFFLFDDGPIVVAELHFDCDALFVAKRKPDGVAGFDRAPGESVGAQHSFGRLSARRMEAGDHLVPQSFDDPFVDPSSGVVVRRAVEDGAVDVLAADVAVVGGAVAVGRLLGQDYAPRRHRGREDHEGGEAHVTRQGPYRSARVPTARPTNLRLSAGIYFG